MPRPKKTAAATAPTETAEERQGRLARELPAEERLALLAPYLPQPRARKAKESKPCLCGCGGVTFSRFVPGHDASLKSRLLKAFRSDDRLSDEQQELVALLGWERFLTSKA